MKVSRRFTPLDMLVFEHKEYRVTVSTHRNTLSIGISKNGKDIHDCHLTPEQFISLLMQDTKEGQV